MLNLTAIFSPFPFSALGIPDAAFAGQVRAARGRCALQPARRVLCLPAAQRRYGMPACPSVPHSLSLLRTLLQVAIVGSFMTQTMALPHTEVDVAVEMPSSLFDDKDRLNHRYTHFRALYLAVLADGLQEHPQDFAGVRFTYFQVWRVERRGGGEAELFLPT